MYSSNCEFLSLRRNRCGKIYLLAATIPRAALVDMSNEVSSQVLLYPVVLCRLYTFTWSVARTTLSVVALTLSVVLTTLSVVHTTLSVVGIYSVGWTHYSVGCVHSSVGYVHYFVGCTHYSVGCVHYSVSLYALLCPLSVMCRLYVIL